MANYPFKINIQKGDGSQVSYYTSSFANSGMSAVSSSTIVSLIENMPRGDSYIQSEAAVATSSGQTYDDSNEGNSFLTVSTNDPMSGSIIFTDTETSVNGGLDFYTFWGSKVCSVLGLAEGIPISTANFKLSDDSSNPNNYLSGDVISDSISVKDGFKMSPQARMRSNIVWDKVFGEGALQWVDGNENAMIVGYDDVADQYKITFKASVTSTISGVDTLSAGSVTTALVANCPIVHNNAGDIQILSGRQTYSETDYDRGQLHLDTAGNNVIVGQLKIQDSESETFASSMDRNDFTLYLRNNHSDTVDNFAGIAFDVGTEDDSDAIMGAIAVLRDNTTSTLHDGNMIFCTNDDADDDLEERMRIHHDGGVKVHKGLGVGTDGPTTVGLIRATNDVIAFYSSDEKLKDNLIKISNPLDKISQLNGYEFDWIEKQGIHENEGHDVGVVAQEVEKVIPEIVQTRDNGYKAVKYEKMIPLLIESIKEQQKQIEDLKREVKELKNG